MGKANRERIERINAGKELPRSVTHPNKTTLGWRFRKGGKSVHEPIRHRVADQQRRDRVKKLTAFGAMSPLP